MQAKKKRDTAAVVELYNAVVELPDPSELTPQVVEEVGSKYGMRVQASGGRWAWLAAARRAKAGAPPAASPTRRAAQCGWPHGCQGLHSPAVSLTTAVLLHEALGPQLDGRYPKHPRLPQRDDLEGVRRIYGQYLETLIPSGDIQLK